MYVCLCTQDQGWVWACECVCACPFPSPVDTCLYVCVRMYMYINTAKWLRLHKAILLQLIMKRFALKIVSYSTTCNLINKQSANNSTKRNSLTDTLANCVSSSNFFGIYHEWYKCNKFADLKISFIHYNLYVIALKCSLIAWSINKLDI